MEQVNIMSIEFRTVLIANRGEIACRIIRTLQKMGIKSVAVYSEADRDARHVKLADQAIPIGPAPSVQSYLNIDNIILAAKRCNADAIHPGYGFLSENPALADACKQNNIVFIGPPVSAIRAMGSKSAAKALMQKAGVPLIPGYHGDNQDPDVLKAEADKIGYPVLLKAALGGGGKGMRAVQTEDQFHDALASCKREAMASFNDETILIEKYIENPRHIEVQIFCDQQGNAVHLFERDCSIQRRHQKIIEEAPAPNLANATRESMTRDAIAAAKAVDYVGAGTVEFLMDDHGGYYFMEMNTRLQVEHPVTEMITGQDLVEWQILVAQGYPLPKRQDALQISGHAIEARICAEDPLQDFIPSIGDLTLLGSPAQTSHIRLDSSLNPSDHITVYYDPMVAKMIVWDTNRNNAIRQLQSALEKMHIDGIATNIGYLNNIISSEAFIDCKLSTRFIERHENQLKEHEHKSSTHFVAAATFELLTSSPAKPLEIWDTQTGWKLNSATQVQFHYTDNTNRQTITLSGSEKSLSATTGDTQVAFSAKLEGNRISLTGDIDFSGYAYKNDNCIILFSGTNKHVITKHNPLIVSSDHHGHHKLSSPMPGVVTRILVETGDSVKVGQPLIVLEAMKMEHVIRSDQDGIVQEIFCREGETAKANRNLIDII